MSLQQELTISNLLKLNEPEVLAPIFGWVMASYLKPQVFFMKGAFPLLGVWGGRGCGKTRTLSMFGELYSADSAASHVSLSHFGTHALSEYSRAPSATPKVFEEFDKALLRPRKKYDDFCFTFKQVYNSKHVAPIIISSENQLEDPGLRDRTYSVEMHADSLRPRVKHFDWVEGNLDSLRQVPNAAACLARKVTDEWVSTELKRFEDTSRQMFCVSTILLGLSFAEKVMCGRMKLNLSEEIRGLRESFLKHVDKSIDT